MTGLLIGLRGIGGMVFSRGLDALASEAKRMGWQAKVYPFTSGNLAAQEWKDFKGPIVVIWHSAGEQGAETFAKALGRKIDVGIAVDSWLPGQTVNEAYQRVISIISAADSRFHVSGHQVVEKIVAPGTWHITVDDSELVRQTLLREMQKLTGTPVDITPPKETGMTLFEQWTPVFMRMLMEDFNVSELDAAAVFGNAGHESAGYATLQEIKPLVAGSAGGWGIMQWTGPRRRAFEAYCERNGYDKADMLTNYKWLFVELKGPEGKVLPKLKAAGSLEAKVQVFSDTFLRPGIPHMSSRIKWAKMALAIWQKNKATTTTPVVPTSPSMPEPVKPHVAAPVGDLDAFLAARYPDTEAEARQRAAMLADAIAFRLSPNPPSAGFSLPKSQGTNEMKSFLQSKTIWGVITMVVANVLPTVLPVLGYEFTSADAQSLLGAVQTIVEAAGAILAIYGRIVAKDALTFIK